MFILAAAASETRCREILHDVNYAGNDLNPGSPASSAAECCALCEANSKCVYWTFCPHCKCAESAGSAGCCHPKSSKAGAKPAPGRISGQSGTYRPPPPPAPAPPGVKNVLLMIADDLRPQLMAAYGHSWMKTPNIDKFTRTATVFLRAYVQQQVCSPSRNSFMTGRRPDATGVWNFNDDFRVHRSTADPEDTAPGNGANWTTMPQYFKNHGYQVYGTGKLFHPNRPANNDVPLSWTDYSSDTGKNASCNGGQVVYSSAKNTSTGEGRAWRKIVGCEENDKEAQLTYAAIQYLHQAVGSNSSSSGSSSQAKPLGSYRPFFIGMGHREAHKTSPIATQRSTFDAVASAVQ